MSVKEVDMKELKKAMSEIRRSNDLAEQNFEHLKEDFQEVKAELKGITEILRTLIVHEEKINNMNRRMSDHEKCSIESGSRDVKIKHLEEEVDSIKTDLKKLAYTFLAAIVGAVIDFFLR